MALACALSLSAQDARVSDGYDHFYNLEFDQAVADFTAETRQAPEDPAAWNHLAQAILYRAMYRGGALESELVTGSNPFLRRQKLATTPAEQQQFYDCITRALDLAESRLTDNAEDAQALDAQGVSYGLRANYNFLVRKAWVDALRDATNARKAHKRVTDFQPDNVDARLVLGLYDYVAGSLPLGYRILGFVAGYHGDRNRGIRTLQSVAKDGTSNRVDAQVVLAAIYRRERRPREAIPLLQDLSRTFPRNFLLRFEIVQMYSDLGDKAKALAELARVRELKSAGAPGFKDLMPEKIDYMEGNLLFWYSDLDAALENMKRVTAKAPELDLNTALMSWMRLGQIYDLQRRREPAIAAYKNAVGLAPQSQIGNESRRYIARPYNRVLTDPPLQAKD